MKRPITFLVGMILGMVLIAAIPVESQTTVLKTETVHPAWRAGEIPAGKVVLGIWRVGPTWVGKAVFMDDHGTAFEYYGEGTAWRADRAPDFWAEIPWREP